ncbi:MAG: glycosyltransferase [Intrasporangium sp.]|uniref:glycosyltransferase n=1 Tax=Intrasporangium sp. TaxID=1925024 RepID=UPI002648F43B|nr:glycosyltransferase [Intrasporangium sp.]MDN5794378.1 glycosyltransferase [Intrasporangium sp.]
MSQRGDAAPLVTCVLPTGDRALFAAKAFEYFARQTYARRELVVVDTGQVRLDLALPRGARVVVAEAGTPLGQARNLGAAQAKGSFIAHWDDDDWYAPDRLARQVAILQDQPAQVCGAGSLLTYRVLDGDAWRYRPLPGDATFVAGSTLMYRSAFWREFPLPPLDVGEDAAWLAGLPAGAVAPMSDDGWFVAVVHGANTAARNLADERWSPVGIEEVSARLGADRAFYATLRRGGTPPAPVHRRESAITVVGDLLVYDGLGSMTEYAALTLDRAGADVRLRPLSLDRRSLARRTLELLDRPPAEGPVLYWTWPREELSTLDHDELFVRLAWESSRVPASWPEALAGCRALVVPSVSVADACIASGIDIPVVVVPDGVDPQVHHGISRPERTGLTTLVVATVIPRKHLAEVIASWHLAFDGDPAARLVVKARFQAGGIEVDDDRITVVDTDEPTRGIAHWYAQSDVLLALGNEGFGLPVVEAMATGLPVVVLDSEGQHDVCRDAAGLVLPVVGHPAPFNDPRYGRCGTACVPDVADAARQLRWVDRHRDEARALGLAASTWALRHRNVWELGSAVLGAMEEHARPSRPLRRRRTLWVSSWGSRCGVSEYAGHLVGGLDRAGRNLPPVTVTRQAPDRRGLRLLHVQHEDALFDDATLTAYLDGIAEPVVVTEHSVGQEPRPWEERADLLIALTEEGARRLRARLDEGKVAHLPHGCPTWFPERKRRRGRVIGSFGLLAPYKGFTALATAVGSLPGAELVLYSHPRSSEDAARFERTVAGLPVRWHQEWLPARDAATALAAECDALALWYEAAPVAAASGAARVALATGVPVLTSPTAWFADLRHVTHQPDDLVEGIGRMLEDTSLRDRLSLAAREYCHAHSWRRIAAEQATLWQSVESA